MNHVKKSMLLINDLFGDSLVTYVTKRYNPNVKTVPYTCDASIADKINNLFRKHPEMRKHKAEIQNAGRMRGDAYAYKKLHNMVHKNT